MNKLDRPWREDKRSWIFYLDKIKNNENIITGEVDDNTFLFDCETARLSIWSTEWNTFIDVGVRNFINQVDGRSYLNRSDSMNTRIFYKGVEIQSKCMGQDAGILECIDIKGELDRTYINISRKGFTAEGETYFGEKLYPGLLQAVHKVLKYLERAETDKNFAEIIEKIVDKKCKSSAEEEKKELIVLIVSISILAYYAMRDEWNISEKLYEEDDKDKSNTWSELLEKINSILTQNEKLCAELSDMTSFFAIDVYTVDHKPYNPRGRRTNLKFNFLQFFLKYNHWAILQSRRNENSNWVDYPVLIKSESIKSIEYDKMTDLPYDKDNDELLEGWADKLCNADNTDKMEAGTTGQQIILNWMLKNIPTIGMVSNENGSMRANILSNRIYPGIYMNTSFKRLLLQKIVNVARVEEIQRFSTIAWQNMEFISCGKLPFCIYFVKSGRISSYSYHKIIIPFDGRFWNKVSRVLAKEKGSNGKISKIMRIVELADIKKKLLEYANDINGDGGDAELKKRVKICTQQERMQAASYIAGNIFDILISIDFKRDYDIDKLMELSDEVLEKCAKIYAERAKIYFNNLQETDIELMKKEWEEWCAKNKDNMELKILCSIWIYVGFSQEDVLKKIDGVDNCYKEYIQECTDYPARKENIINYILKNGDYNVAPEQIRRKVDKLEKEIVSVLNGIECRGVSEKLEELRRSYMIFAPQSVQISNDK